MPTTKTRAERLRSLFERHYRLSEAVRAAMRSRFAKADIIREAERAAHIRGLSRGGLSYSLLSGGISRMPQRRPKTARRE